MNTIVKRIALASTIGLMIVIVLVVYQKLRFLTLEPPMWEGFEKNENMKQADARFLKAIDEQFNGDRRTAARGIVGGGFQFIGIGDADTAMRRFNQAWLLNPDEPTIYWGFAVAADLQGYPKEQIYKYLAKAEAAMPGDLKLLTTAAYLKGKHGDLKQAREELEQVMAINPKFEEAIKGMIWVCHQLADYSCEAEYQKRVSVK